MSRLAGSGRRRWNAGWRSRSCSRRSRLVPALVIEQTTHSPVWANVATILNWGSWLVFALEIVVMLRVVPSRRQWARRRALDIVITLVTFPVALSALQSLRLMRLTRLLRAARLLRLVRAGQLGHRWFTPAGLRWSAFIVALAVLASAEAFTLTEQRPDVSVWDAIWWALTTTTTVGYGDISPTTVAGRIIAICLMLVGIGFVAMLTAAVAQRFTAGQRPGPEVTGAEVLTELRAFGERLARIEEALLNAHPATDRPVERAAPDPPGGDGK